MKPRSDFLQGAGYDLFHAGEYPEFVARMVGEAAYCKVYVARFHRRFVVVRSAQLPSYAYPEKLTAYNSPLFRLRQKPNHVENKKHGDCWKSMPISINNGD